MSYVPDVDGCSVCGELKWKIVRGTYWTLVLNRDQRLLGKTMLVLSRHAEEVSALTLEEWSGLLADQVPQQPSPE